MFPIIEIIYALTGLSPNNEAAKSPPLNSSIGNIEIIKTITSLPNLSATIPLNKLIIALTIFSI